MINGKLKKKKKNSHSDWSTIYTGIKFDKSMLLSMLHERLSKSRKKFTYILGRDLFNWKITDTFFDEGLKMNHQV